MTFVSASRFHVYLVRAFSIIVKTDVPFAALI